MMVIDPGFIQDNKPRRIACNTGPSCLMRRYERYDLLIIDELRHLFHVVVNDGNYQAEWAVARRKRSGKIFAFHSFDTYQFDQQNKISFLKVKLEK